MFKTIYSRFGNVKANKYVASEADMASSNYSEDEFENLNDIETVLTSVGIKLRENADTWRNIDDVISEVAEKWKTWDKTTQNAVATVVAGTRQRENVITLFENWDDVAKYAEIAENAYGTATKKMEAYTTSIEASQQRLTVAVEELALKLNRSDALKAFYDLLAFSVENLDALIVSLGGLLIALKGTSIITTFYSGLSKLGLKLMEIGAVTPSAQNGWKIGDIQREQSKKTAVGNIVTAYSQKIEQDYNNVLTTYMGTLTQANQATAAQINTQMQLLNVSDQKILGEQMLVALGKSEQALGFQELTENGKQIVSQIILNGINEKIIETNSALIKQKLEQIASGQQVELSDEELAQMQKLYADYIKSQMGQGNQVYTTMGTYYAGAKQRQEDLEKKSKQATITGSTTIVGGLVGSVGGGWIGKKFGELLGDEGAGKTVGTVLGSTAGAWAAKSIATKVPAALSAATAAGTVKIAAVLGAAGGPIGVAIGLAGAAIIAIGQSIIKKQLEKALKEFQEAASKFSAMKGSDIDAARLDELSNGVDKLGRNVSLTKEEYQEFLELNNSLAELYPGLIMRIDEAGNHFVGLGDSVGGVTEKIKELIDDQQKITDEAMFKETLGGGFLGLGRTTVAGENLETAQETAEQSYFQIMGYSKPFVTETSSRFDNNDYDDLLNQDFNDFVYNDDPYNNVLQRAGISLKEAKQSLTILSSYKQDPSSVTEDERQRAEEIYQELKVAFKTLLEEVNNKERAVTVEMADEMDSAVRNMYRTEFNGMSDEESYHWQQIRGNISAFDKSGKKLSDKKFYDNTQKTFKLYNDAFLNHKDGQDMLEIATKKVTDYQTIDDYTADRDKIKTHFTKVFGEDGFDETEMSVILGLKFEVDENGQLVDAQSFEKQFDDLGIQDTSTDSNQISQENLKQLKPKDAQKALELIKSGAIEATGSMSTLVELLYADRGMPTTLEGATKYASEKLSEYDNLLNRIKDEDVPFENVIKGIENVNEEFSKYPTTIREALKIAQEELESGNVKTQDVLDALENNINAHRVDILKGVAQVGINEVFGDDVLSNIEGIIDTFEELKNTLESIGNAYSRFGEAQKEYNKYGRLSTQTVAELMASNSNYAKVLKRENGVFTLSADAQKIMAAEQASATIVSLKAAQAAIKVSQAEKEKELAIIDETLAQYDNEDAVTDNIEGTKAWTRATGTLVGFLKGLGAAITALTNGENVGDAFDAAYQEQKTITDSAIQEMTWKQQYSAMDKEELQNRKLEMEQEIIDLQNEYDVYEGMISDFQKAIETGEYGFLGEDFGLDLDFEDAMTELEKLESALENINKEWEAMQVYSKELGKELKPTEYFDKMDSNLTAQETLLKNQLAKGGLSEQERFDAENKLQEVQFKLLNLDDEEIEDKIKIAQLEGASLATMKDLQTELIKSSDTYEERLQRQRDYNGLLEDELQLVKTRGDLIDEETYAREQFAKNGGALSDSSYYDDQKAQIKAERKAIEDILANDINPENGAKLTEEEKLKYQKELLDLDNKEANIEDERLEKMLKEAEAQNASLDIRKDLQKQLIAEADTQDELLERQKTYNDLLKEEQGLRESIASSLNDEYLAMQAFQSGGKTTFYDLKGKALTDVQDAIDTRLMNNKFAKGEVVPVAALETGNAPVGLDIGTYVSTADGRIYEIVGIGENSFGSIEAGEKLGYSYNSNNGYWSKETDYIANGTPLSKSDYISLISDQQGNYVDQQNLDDERIQHQINLLKGQKADLSAVTAQYKQLIETADTEEEFYNYYQQYLDAFIAEFDDKISDTQRQIDDLQKARPQEWKSTLDNNGKIIASAESKIKSYYSKMDTYYNNQLSSAQAALRYSSELTEDEIEHLVDTANDAIKAIHDNAIAKAEDLKNYQESVYSALTNEVQRYIDDLEKQKEVVEETYNKELEKLQDKEDAIARTNKLIELQNNLLNAQKEKERVYREGKIMP